MIPIRGITVCVDYAWVLAKTLPLNMRHLQECLVITCSRDMDTINLCRSIPSVRLYVTDAFTRHGARFNKGLAMEEGFDVLGRHGWTLIWDADCLLPDQFPYAGVRDGYLHGCRRRIVERPEEWTSGSPWGRYPIARDGGPIGYFQLFHAEDPAVKDRRPWYEVGFAYAAGGDSYFLEHWPPHKRTILSIDVLHFGPRDINWFGSDPEGREIMRAFVARNGWRRMGTRFDPEAVSKVGEIQDRVEVPGYPKSTYEIPFVRRAKQMAGR